MRKLESNKKKSFKFNTQPKSISVKIKQDLIILNYLLLLQIIFLSVRGKD